ncbi:MAG TPA: SDR family oxidoreductase [Marmoricola sp.]|jgi:uncharacterized protein YbjT (DUF2867 family)|nr:SDR family oxidoreductase [Marmoricola sp.]
MSRIAVIGGHGKVALQLNRLLSDAGDHVSAVIRNPAHAEEVRGSGATPVVADIETLDTEGLAAILEGHDAVVWSAGAGGGSRDRTYAVDRDAAIRSMEAAAIAGIRRYVMVSWFGSGPDHGVPEDEPFFAYADAKAAADDHLRGTTLEWTVLGPSRLTDDEPTGRIETAPAAGAGSVARGDVAAVVQAVLVDPATVRRTIEFNNGDEPIARALT